MSKVVTTSWSASSEERAHVTGKALLFQLGSVAYGVSVEFVERVIELQEMTQVPGGDPWLCGMVVEDFLPYPVIDSGYFLQPGRESGCGFAKAIVIKSAHGSVLVGVDKLVTIADLSSRTRVKSNRSEFPDRFIEYICKSEDRLIGVISVPALLATVTAYRGETADGAFR